MINFSASSTELWLAAAGVSAAAGALGWLEWQRPDRRRLPWRLGAVLLAVAALALLGLHPAWRRERELAERGGIVAGLWTSGRAGDDAAIPARYRIALPGAGAVAGRATVFPDAATLRRRYPEVTTIQVFGDGLDAGGLDALRGLRVLFQPGAPDTSAPSIRFVHYPRTLSLGEPLIVQGEVAGLAPGAQPALTLETPAGSTVKTLAVPAVTEGRANFTLCAASPPATGRFTWQLRLMPPGQPGGSAVETESLGVAVVKPTLPRVLALESSPHFDTADLRRWFARAGGQFVTRTMVGRDRDRFASAAAETVPEFARIDTGLLNGFDLVLADPAALAALAPPEQAALLAAVTDAGLGVLAFGDETAASAGPGHPLFPWQMVVAPDASAAEGESLERPAWFGQNDPIATPIPAAPVLLVPHPGQSALMRDGQGRTLAAAMQRGRGQIALTLLHDSGRWLRGNDAAAFGEYWSFLFSRLARPLSGETGAGHWAIAESAPIFAGQPVTLLWSGSTPLNLIAQVTAGSGVTPDNARLALARDPGEPGQWRGTFWPRQAGWYSVSAGSTPEFDFFVDGIGRWLGVSAESRRFATERFAQDSVAVAPAFPRAAAKGNTAGPAVCCFLIFLAGAGFLWSERRLSAAAAA